jgi:uncharacterized protein YkwD
MLFIKTIVISSLIGIIGGSSAGILYKNISSVQANTNIPSISITQPLLLSDRIDCCTLYEDKAYQVSHDITAAVFTDKASEEEVNTEASQAQPVVAKVSGINISEPKATSSAQELVVTKEQTLAQSITLETKPATNLGSLDADLIFELVNQLRSKAGLTIFEKDPQACELAQSRAPQLFNEIVVSGNMHAGLYNRDLPYFVTENIIYMQTEQQAIDWWLSSRVHRSQLYGDFKYSCVACLDHSCTQIFTNHTPKTL